MTSNQLKVVFNQDGSIKVFEFPKYITQGSNGATKLTVAIDGANIQSKSVIARFKLEGEQSDTTNTLVFNINESSVEVYGDTYNYAKSVYLTAAQTAFAGVLLCSIEVLNADNILYSYSCRLTINPTTYDPDSTDTMINNAQYENLVEMLNFATELVSHDVEYVDDISSASASDYNEGMIIFNKANRFWYEVKNDAFVRLNALFIGTGNGEGSGTITADQFNTIKEDTLVITPYTNIFRCQNKSVTDNGNTITWTFVAKSASWLQSNDYRICLVRKSGSSYNFYFYSLSNYVYYGSRDGFDGDGNGYRDTAVPVSTFANSIFNVYGNEITGWNKDAKIITEWNIIYHLIDVAHGDGQYVLYFANDDIRTGTNKAYQKHFRIVWGEGNSNTDCAFYQVGPDFKTVGGETILGSGNIDIKTVNGYSIMGYGNAQVCDGENLLINPDFSINQRGATSLTDVNGTYFVDRWRVVGSAEYTPLDASTRYMSRYGIKLTNILTSENCARLIQPIEDVNKFLGYAHVTLSCSVEGTVISASGTIGSLSGTLISGSKTIGHTTFTLKLVYDSTTETMSFVIEATENDNSFSLLYINWAKLELGEHPTRFVPPLIAEELPKCQRYYQTITSFEKRVDSIEQQPFVGFNNFYIMFPVTMRTTPTKTISGLTIKMFPSGTTYSDYTMLPSATNKRINIIAEKQTATAAGDCTLVIGSGAYIKLDAEIY